MRTLLLALLLSASAGAQAPGPRPVTIGSMDSIWSPTLKEYRRFWTYTPPSYRQTTYFPRGYPVLYLLDGDAHFHSVTGLLQILGTGVNGTYVVPEMIVIAIPNTNRTRDLTPTKSMLSPDGTTVPGFAVSGGGANFLQFVRSELIPHVDSSFRTEPYRVLVGHSFGGITALSALYTMPDVFNAYVAIDPSLWWDNQSLLKQAKDYFRKPAAGKRALYVAQANTKSIDETKAALLAVALRSDPDRAARAVASAMGTARSEHALGRLAEVLAAVAPGLKPDAADAALDKAARQLATEGFSPDAIAMNWAVLRPPARSRSSLARKNSTLSRSMPARMQYMPNSHPSRLVCRRKRQRMKNMIIPIAVS